MGRHRHCMMDEDYTEECDGECENAELCKKLKQPRGKRTIIRTNRADSINPGQLCFIAYMAILIIAMLIIQPKTPAQAAFIITGLITITLMATIHQGFEIIQE